MENWVYNIDLGDWEKRPWKEHDEYLDTCCCDDCHNIHKKYGEVALFCESHECCAEERIRRIKENTWCEFHGAKSEEGCQKCLAKNVDPI